MCEEIERIIRTIYRPDNRTGDFMKTNWKWTNNDKLDSDQLERVFTLYLWQIQSEQTTVFRGYAGVLKLDVSESEGIGLPGTDYEYTEAFDLNIVSGIEMIAESTGAESGGENETIPDLFTGDYRGIATIIIHAKKADIGTAGFNLIPKIGDILASGELAKVVLYHTTNNQEAVPATLTQTIEGYVTEPASPLTDADDLVKFRLRMKLFKPVTLTTA